MELALGNGNERSESPESKRMSLGARFHHYDKPIGSILFDDKDTTAASRTCHESADDESNPCSDVHLASVDTPFAHMHTRTSCKVTGDCGSTDLSMKFGNIDKSYLSLSPPGVGKDSTQENTKRRVEILSSSDGISYQLLHYEAPDPRFREIIMEDAYRETENNQQQLNSPLGFSTTTSSWISTPANGGSPPSILRSSAMGFSTPSIIRKKACRKACDASYNNRTSTPASAASQTREKIHVPSEDAKDAVVPLFVGRRLELAFDIEMDLAGEKL